MAEAAYILLALHLLVLDESLNSRPGAKKSP
jgi:hypothetical protein